MTRDDYLKYVNELEPSIRSMFFQAEQEVMVRNDTLSEEFQIAAEIVDVFKRRAEERQ